MLAHCWARPAGSQTSSPYLAFLASQPPRPALCAILPLGTSSRERSRLRLSFVLARVAEADKSCDRFRGGLTSKRPAYTLTVNPGGLPRQRRVRRARIGFSPWRCVIHSPSKLYSEKHHHQLRYRLLPKEFRE